MALLFGFLAGGSSTSSSNALLCVGEEFPFSSRRLLFTEAGAFAGLSAIGLDSNLGATIEEAFFAAGVWKKLETADLGACEKEEAICVEGGEISM